jgi:hypothetical protein
MTDQPGQSVDTSQHQDEYQLQQNDALDIALLANIVGTELTQVDKFAVSGTKKATRIDQQKIFNKPSVSSTPAMTAQAPKPTGLPPELQQVQPVKPQEPPSPVLTQAPVPPPQVTQVAQIDERVFNYLKAIEQRLEKMESIYNSILESIQNNSEQITVTLSKNDKD